MQDYIQKCYSWKGLGPASFHDVMSHWTCTHIEDCVKQRAEGDKILHLALDERCSKPWFDLKSTAFWKYPNDRIVTSPVTNALLANSGAGEVNTANWKAKYIWEVYNIQ